VIPDSLTVRDLASLLSASPIDVIKVLMANGVLANINQPIDFDTAAVEPEEEEAAEAQAPARPKSTKFDFYAGEAEADLQPRPPIVTVLGHVDHGKTTLLDAIRKSNVVASEAGGITQRIGAYQVEYGDGKITFIDTPGHEAFTAMRARGAQATDVAVLVVAADDGVMPQTREAIDHARAAQVPIVVALNKVDLPGANPERVKQQLAELGLTPDEWGGDTLLVEVSALRAEGIEELLEAITLQAEDLDCRANPDTRAAGTVIESTVDRSRGPLATLLVQNGTLRRGDVVVVGTIWGRVRAMFDENGRQVETAPPSTPVQVMGLSDVPAAGNIFRVVESDREAKELVADRVEAAQTAQRERRAVTLEDLLGRLQAGETEELNIIVKTDAQGSIEPVVSSLERIQSEERRVRVLHASTGNVGESDVNLAVASGALIIGFNVGADPAARRVAEGEGVEIRTYDVIYHLIEDIERMLAGMAEPTYEAVTIGHAEVRQVFQVRTGTVAGCYVTSGRITRNAHIRVLRGGQNVWEGTIASLRRFTEDVREVREGFECGVSLDGFNDIREGDVLEAFVMRQVK
jgi:translation initiation factor IF-2